MLFGFLQAQHKISFDAAESYTLGDINTQNRWVVTGDGLSGFISNQVVSDEMANDGIYSFKINEDTDFGGQCNVIAADIYMSELDGVNFRLGTVNLGLGQFTMILEFDYLENIWVVENDAFVDTGVSWSALTRYNIRLETTGSTVKYFIDDV